MKQVTAFHNGEILWESEQWQNTKELPDQAYIRQHFLSDPNWYRIKRTETRVLAIPINESDIPNWVRAWVLILT
jgi:hypothetical protein